VESQSAGAGFGPSLTTLCVKRTNMEVITSEEVSNKIKKYPKDVQLKLEFLRKLILEKASEIESINKIEETLKWGEPSFTTKQGSTIRIDWKEKYPNQYAMYFHCKTKLVDTFRERYKNTFKFESNRAIIFNMNDNIPVEELKHCIELSLLYHSIKDKPMLGL
jgi:Domain of unknown function (DU1801)